MMRRTLVEQRRTKPDAAESLPPVGRNTPAARAYSNARRAGRTQPGKIEKQKDGRKPHRANRADRRAAGGYVGAISSQVRRGPGKPLCVCGRILRPFQLAPCGACRANAEAARAAEAVTAR